MNLYGCPTLCPADHCPKGPITMTSTYGCTVCGHQSDSIGESFDHTGTVHAPFTARCADGYTRQFATEDEALAASVDGTVRRYRTAAEEVAEARARRLARGQGGPR